MSLSPKEYLYDVKGPWPQPNQALDLWPIVAHMPKKELRKFQWKIGLRYIKQCIFYTPIALWYAWRNPGLSPLSDEAYTDYLCLRSFSKFMYRASDIEIKKYLPGIDMSHVEKGKVYFISDLYLMRHIPSQDGQYVAPTVALFEQVDVENDYYRPVAIYIESNPIKGSEEEEEHEQSKVVVYPGDGSAWELAKYYVLHGCAYRIVFSMHSTLHFPMDALNAISKTILPKDNLILKMLLPHLEFSLELDFVVQTTYSSPIKNHQEFPYTGVTGTADEIAQLFVDAHAGVDTHPRAYPPFHFKLKPQSESYCEYYRFQMEYYRCFKRFAAKALNYLTEEEKKELIPWAKYIQPFINKHIATPEHSKYYEDVMKHFPTEFELFTEHKDEPVLDRLIATLMWDLTIGHAGDHYDFGMMEMSHMPMRLRIPPPSSRHIPDFDRKDLRTFWDTFKHRLEWKMFYMPTNVTQLYDTDYKFNTPELKALNKEFLADLKRTEEGLEAKGIRNFMPLKIIARSIQY